MDKLSLHLPAPYAQNTPVLVAFSGGADSSLLLHLLKDAGVPLYAVHVHHGLRGADADADLAFCEKTCRALHVPFFAVRIHAQALEALGHQTDFKRQEVLDKQLEAIISPKIDLDTAVQGFTTLASENTFNTETQFSYILDQIMDTATAYVEKEPNSTLGKNFTEVLTNYEKNMYIHLGNTSIGTLPPSYIQGQYGETLGSGVQIKLKAVYDLLQACIEEDSSKTKPLGYHLKRTLVTLEETKKYYTNLGRALDIYAYGKDSSLSSAQETLIHINGLAAHEEALVEKAQTKIKHRFYPEMSIPTLPRRAQTTR